MNGAVLIDFSFSLLLNAALLLSLVQIIDLAMARGRVDWLSRPTWVVGLIVGIIGVLLIKVSTTLMPGVIFDTRSVLLSICGLFLGTVPTVVAMAMTAGYRWSLGGAAAWTGVTVIVASGLIGLGWRRVLRRPIESLGWRQLYPLGLATHAAMLGLMLLMPWEMALEVLARISLPVVVIHPLITVALGFLLAERLQRQNDLLALRDREERFKRLFEASPVPLGLADREGRIVAQNARYVELFGYTTAEVPAIAAWWPLAYPDPDYRFQVQTQWNAALAKATATNAAIEVGEFRVTCKDGTERIVRISSMSLPEGLLTAFIDLTAIRAAEQALIEAQTAARRSWEEHQKASELLAAIADATDDAIFAKDREGRYLLFNRAASRFTGQPTEAVLGRDDRAIFPAEQAEMLIAAGEMVMRQQQTLTQEERLTTPTGERVFLATKGPLRDSAGEVIGLFGVSRDITEQKQRERKQQIQQETALEQQKRARLAALNQMEDANAARANAEAALAALRESEGRLRLFIEHAPAALAIFDRDMRYLAVSRRWLEDFALDGEELVGRSHYEVFPEIGEKLKSAHRRGLAGEVVRADEELFERADGSSLWLRWEVRPWHTAEGRVGGIAIFSEDITGRKEAETALRRLNEELEGRVRERTTQLEEANKELEAFSYSVSHDLKAPLRGIDGYSRLLEEDFKDRLDDEGRRFLANIRLGTAQMHQLIEDLLAYSRIERRTLQPMPLDLPALVRAVLAECTPLIEQSGAELLLAVPELRVSADRDGLAIVLRNLLENALKFRGTARPPVVEIGARLEGERVLVWVRDNGIGFDMKFHDRIFAMFQRLQRSEDYPGTGIGLALVRKAMLRMGGRVWGESTPGEGATFYLELPR
jgi:PAS domain S-box-containing protein